MEIHVFNVIYTDFSYKDSFFENTIELYYNHWKTTEIGKWCTENNIRAYSKEPYKNVYTYEIIVPFFILVNCEQHKELQEIKFYEKLTS